MIRVLVVDDHPAPRAGLSAVLDAEPELVYVGASAGDDESLWPALDPSGHDQAPRPDLRARRGVGSRIALEEVV